MGAELLAIGGPRLGERFDLASNSEIWIGRAPEATIRLDDPEVGWRHCFVKISGRRYQLIDGRTAGGTFANGRKIAKHWLTAGDQVNIGESVFVYTEEPMPIATVVPKTTLLRTCSMLFLFRAVVTTQNAALRGMLEGQLLRLIADLVPSTGGALALGTDALEMAASLEAPFQHLVERACKEGAVFDAKASQVAIPLYVRSAVAGVLIAQFPAQESARLADHCDTLAAVGTLGAMALENAREIERLNAEKAILLEHLDLSSSGMVGDSAALRKLSNVIGRVAAAETSALVLGESGVGKEMVARALHSQSRRAQRPFVAINCAAVSETLLESELFGHEKGAFTSADAQKKGKLELAEGGTVFLDEIGELALPSQAKLLRVLQQREFERVGGTRTLKLDVRLIAATNRDLLAEVRQGRFREDLFHRLNVVAIHVPPLRERKEDIPALVRHFLVRAAARCRRRVTAVSPEASAYLMAYSWPGNIRELENAVERAVVLGQSEVVLAEDLPETVLDAQVQPPLTGALQTSVADSKRQLILRVWEASGGDYKAAAAKLDIHPNSLRRLVRTLGLREML